MVNTIRQFRKFAGTMLLLLGGGLVYAQPASVSITLDLDNVPVEQAMRAIESQSRYLFINKGIDTGMTVSADVDAAPVQEALSQMFDGTDVAYSFDGTYIILSERQQASQQGPLTVSGTITDQAGLPVPGAAILIAGTNTGVVSDIDGKYSITIDSPDADTRLQVSILGYAAQEFAVNGRAVINVVMQKRNP